MSIAEGMAVGLPVVAPRVGGIIEVVEDNVSGILIEPDNLDAMAEALLSIMTQPEQARDLGRAARERILNLFSPNVIVPRYEVLYERLARPASPTKDA